MARAAARTLQSAGRVRSIRATRAQKRATCAHRLRSIRTHTTHASRPPRDSPAARSAPEPGSCRAIISLSANEPKCRTEAIRLAAVSIATTSATLDNRRISRPRYRTNFLFTSASPLIPLPTHTMMIPPARRESIRPSTRPCKSSTKPHARAAPASSMPCKLQCMEAPPHFSHPVEIHEQWRQFGT